MAGFLALEFRSLTREAAVISGAIGTTLGAPA
jgi:hypothetical protein